MISTPNIHLHALLLTSFCALGAHADEGLEFFEKRVRPVLIQHCYRCHSTDANEVQGGLRLDIKAGWEKGGDSGTPAIVPRQPDNSPLIHAITHASAASAMPPKQAKLSEAVIADLKQWIADGAVDPRDGKMEPRDKPLDWESTYQSRLKWWSLQPIQHANVPTSNRSTTTQSDQAESSQPLNAVDAFIRAGLQSNGLQPAQPADKSTLARRLAFVLTGLPPEGELLKRYMADESVDAYERLVDSLLNSPRFGQRWARHWMDVVHYTDTHGYEWDVPVKNSWRYRDYLVRAFNDDLPYNQFVIEQLAGDLLPPRINSATQVNEALIGPLMLRLGERRHGDNSAVEGISQEAVANMIDTIGKAFLGTTLACAQCHDHKLDAVEQRDYYSLAGMLMSTRFSARSLDSAIASSRSPAQKNLQVIDQLRGVKNRLKTELVMHWLRATEPSTEGSFVKQLRAIPADAKPAAAFPSTIVEFWKRSLATAVTAQELAEERQRRQASNQANLTILEDFTQASLSNTWRWDGMGMQFGLVSDGEIIVADEGDQAILHLLPSGRYSHVWSSRLAGSLQSPSLDPLQPITFSVEGVSGKFSSQAFIVDRALNPERLTFPARPFPAWQTVTAGNFDSLEGTLDQSARRVYFELATKSLNNYFPPRVGYGGASEAEVNDPRSWFGVSRIVRHAPDKPPQDELTRFAPLTQELAEQNDWALRLAALLRGAIERWANGSCRSDDVKLMNDALKSKLLPNVLDKGSELERLVQEYRSRESEIQADQTVGSAAEWLEGRDDPLAIRGVYTDLGEAVPRGRVRFLNSADSPSIGQSSGRLQWAQHIADPRNTLIARVYVNRVWQYLYGAGLVRTTDDFGHLGELPSHPELLDYLAARFMAEGWSTKKLIRLLVSSATWQQSSVASQAALQKDPENRWWHHLPMRRLEAEALRDSLLAVSGRLDEQHGGLAIEPYRTAEDPMKRLFKGPLDGNGRRSIYLEMTLMEPPRFLALFNQPLPKQTVGRRDVTNVPDQALALLNDPFVIEMANQWSQRLVADNSSQVADRASRMLETAFSRPARADEIAALTGLIEQLAITHQCHNEILQQPAVWRDAAHAIFNLKEFLYVP